MDWLTTATTVDEQQRPTRVAALPVGSFEQHGPHLPLVTDTIIAGVLAQRIATAYDLRLLPPIAMSCSHEHGAWPGTVSISASTLCDIISDIRDSLAGQGIDRLAIVNGHGGNYFLANVVQQANATAESPCMTLYPGREEWASARIAAGLATLGHDDMHAGELETSILLHVALELVGNYRTADHQAAPRPHLLLTGVAGYTDNGVIGSPSLATSAKGAAALDSLTQQFTSHLKLLT